MSSFTDPATPMEQAILRTRRLLSDAEEWLRVRMPATEIRFDLRGTTAGQARLRSPNGALIRYNPALLCRHPIEFIKQTVAQEVAHIVAFVRHGSGIRPHGPEWQVIMRHFGIEPSRCHNYDISRLRTRELRRFAYLCGCSRHELTSIRHKRAQGGGIVYLCRRCRQPLRPEPGQQP